MTEIIIISAPDVESALKIPDMLPSQLKFKYFILIPKPDVKFEPMSDLIDRLTKQSDRVLAKLKKSVSSYVG